MFTFVDDRVTHVTKDSSFACCVTKIKHVLLHMHRVAESQAGVWPVTGRPERPGLPGRIN